MSGRTNSKHVGDTTEARAITTLLEQAYSVSVPFGDNEPYDLVVDDGDVLHRVQCKTAWQDREHTIRFNTHTQTTKNGEYHERAYDGDVDAFLVYYPDRDSFYWIGVDDAGSRKMDLRFEAEIDHPAINWAGDYVFDGEIPQ